MNKIVLVMALLLGFSFAAMAAEKKNEKTITFTVDMDCQSCVKKIEGNIAYEKGVKDLKVSLDNKECKVTYREDKTTPEKLIGAFKKLGYKAEVKPEDTKEKKSGNTDSEHKGHNH